MVTTFIAFIAGTIVGATIALFAFALVIVGGDHDDDFGDR